MVFISRDQYPAHTIQLARISQIDVAAVSNSSPVSGSGPLWAFSVSAFSRYEFVQFAASYTPWRRGARMG